VTLQSIAEQYSAFRKTLGERFGVNGRLLKAFCRAMGQDLDVADVSPEKVSAFLAGKGPLTASWHVKHNALLGFYRYAISRACRGISAAARHSKTTAGIPTVHLFADRTPAPAGFHSIVPETPWPS